jgi:hypothetical protein
LQPDRSVQEKLLLVFFHPLQTQLVPNDLSLVENNENDQPYRKRQHTNGAEKQHNRHISRVSDF